MKARALNERCAPKPELGNKMSIFVIFLFLGGFTANLSGQSNQKLAYVKSIQIHFNPAISLSTTEFQKRFQNKVLQPRLTRDMRSSFEKYMKSQGYYFSRIDSIGTRVEKGGGAKVTIFASAGQSLRLEKISIVNKDSLSDLQRNAVEEIGSLYAGKVYTDALTSILYRDMLNYFENNGYPLAHIQTKGFEFLETEGKEMSIELRLNIDKGDSVTVAYLRFPNGTNKTDSYLSKLLRFRPDSPYRQNRINRYSQILRRQDFIKSVSEPVLMIDRKDRYFVDVRYQESPSTSLDGIVGYIPPPVNSEEKGYFTGLLNIGISNLFGTGRKLFVFWQRQDQYSDEFRLAYREPFVLGLPFHADLGFNRLVRDTTYIDWKYDLKLELPLNEALSAYIKFTSRQVVPDSLASRQLRLPETKSIITESGIEWDLRDNIRNPQRGIRLEVSFSLGQQKNVGPLYLITEDSLPKNVTIQKASADFRFFIPTFKRQVVSNRIHGEGVATSGDMLRQPDMIWFGGATSLRGFREAQFLAERVAWVNSEYRFLLGPESRFFVFADNGYLYRKNPTFEEKWLLGYGLGLRFTSPLGILQTEYGLEKGAPFREGKIHFRLINEF
jgi:outer membrane protein assembly factor BamA